MLGIGAGVVAVGSLGILDHMAYLRDALGADLIGSVSFALLPLDDSDGITTPTLPGGSNMPVLGTTGDDTIDVTRADTSVDAGAGDDTILYNIDLNNGDGPALAFIDGGAGFDIFDYSGFVPGPQSSSFTVGGRSYDAAVAFFGNIGYSFGYLQNGAFNVAQVFGMEVIIASEFNDFLATNFGVERLEGRGGDDSLAGNLEGNVLVGGAGADLLLNNTGGLNVFASYDTATEGVRVSLARNELIGTGDAAGDIFEGGSFGLIGSDFNDYLEGDADDNILDGGLGNDRLVGGDGADTFIGGEGTDLVIFSAASEGVNINLARGTSADGDTFDSIENVQGSQFRDIIIADNGNNLLSGLGGNDVLNGLGGDDNLIGGAGNDVLVGGTGSDTLLGGLGNDVLRGGDGVDALYGGEGNDILNGGAGRDTLNGGEGFDTADYRSAEMGVDVDLGGGNRTNDIFISIERVLGSNFDDTITGSAAADVLVGGAGDDTVDGGMGDDIIYGNDGADTLVASAGRDFLVGGDGADTFVVNSGSTGLNTVLDFSFADTVDLSGLGPDFDTFAEVVAAARNVGNSVIIDFGDARLQLIGVQVDNLTESLFDFGDDGMMA